MDMIVNVVHLLATLVSGNLSTMLSYQS